MKVPKVCFYYSFIYDEALSRKPVNYKRIEKGRKTVAGFQKYWDKKANRILSSMSKISNLKWKTDKIICYFSFFTPFSYSAPLTIRFRKKKEHMLTVLVHELSHNIFVANRERILLPKSKKGLYKKYARETFNTKVHISVEALMKLTLEKVFGKNAEKYLKWERCWELAKRGRRPSEYKRAWEIMLKEGPENILREVVK